MEQSERPHLHSLEAELGRFDTLTAHGPIRQDHGDSDKFFEPPDGTFSRPPEGTKTKSLIPFGLNGTLGWLTPSGRLLSAAACVNNKLVGADSRTSTTFQSNNAKRKKAELSALLQTAIESEKPTHRGLGLNLDFEYQPCDFVWVLNRWPRFTVKHKGLDIRMQYYVENGSIIQQIQARNDGMDAIVLPYFVNSNLSARTHGRKNVPSYVPRGKSADRTFLFGNSEVRVKIAEFAKMKMTTYLNSEREVLWADTCDRRQMDIDQEEDNHTPETEASSSASTTDSSIDSVQETWYAHETQLRNTLSHGRLPSQFVESFYRSNRAFSNKIARGAALSDDKDFAFYKNELTIHAGTTQELCAVITFSPQPPAPTQCTLIDAYPDTLPKQKVAKVQTRRIVLQKQRRLARLGHDKELNTMDLLLIENRFINGHRELAELCAGCGLSAGAGYHSLLSYLIAKQIYDSTSLKMYQASLEYARFALHQGDSVQVLRICKWMQPFLESRIQSLVQDRNLGICDKYSVLWDQLIEIYTNEELFAKAEGLLLNFISDEETHPKPRSPRRKILEKLARLQALQGRYEIASETYEKIGQYPDTNNLMFKVNLGFLTRHAGQLREAENLYRSVRSEPAGGSENEETRDQATSGLFACLRLNGSCDATRTSNTSFVECYLDVNSVLATLELDQPPFPSCGFTFALTRHLEHVLSFSSVPFDDGNVSANSFVAAHPDSCFETASDSCDQFEFLIEYANRLSLNHQMAQRIRGACQRNLTFTFKVAALTKTWADSYTVDGRPVYHTKREPSKNDQPIARPRNGAYAFQKLLLYSKTWLEDIDFVVDLCHLRLHGWLKYLIRERHMDNLWFEKQGEKRVYPRTINSAGLGFIETDFPIYDLSAAALIWLTLTRLEQFLQQIDSSMDAAQDLSSQETIAKRQSIQHSLEFHKVDLSPSRVQSDILRSFILSMDDPTISTENKSHLKAKLHQCVNEKQMSPDDVAKAQSHYESEDEKKAATISMEDESVFSYAYFITSTRSVERLSLSIPHRYLVEAAISGLFDRDECSQSAWQAMLRLHLPDLMNATDTPALALNIWMEKNGIHATPISNDMRDMCLKRIDCTMYSIGFFAELSSSHGEVRQSINSWPSTYEIAILILRILLDSREGPLATTSRPQDVRIKKELGFDVSEQNDIPITIPREIRQFSKFKDEPPVNADFLPSWLYLYPFNIRPATFLPELITEPRQHYPKHLWSKYAMWRAKAVRDFDREGYSFDDINMLEIGAGEERSVGTTYATPSVREHQLWGSKEVWEILKSPRSAATSCRRLLEFNSQAHDIQFICMTLACESEREMLKHFFHRHETAQVYYDERRDWAGNIWNSELHLSFYSVQRDRELISNWKSSVDTKSKNKYQAFSSGKIFAFSFLFTGDLQEHFWTGYFVQTRGPHNTYEGLLGHYRLDGREGERASDQRGKRRIIEASYMTSFLLEVIEHFGRILDAIENETATSSMNSEESTQPDIVGGTFESIYEYSNLHLRAIEILREVQAKIQRVSLCAAQWTTREDIIDFRSRWTAEDEQEYGERRRALDALCKSCQQQLKEKLERLEEQRRFLEQRQQYLVSYMQLREARTSTRSAEDVRLFTYVTIIFLPLSFSSSLFSMQGAPSTGTTSSMIQTTIVALSLTLLLLSNLKLLDRNFESLSERVKTSIRRIMEARDSIWSASWAAKSKELAESARLQQTRSNHDKHSPAASTWWYLVFLISLLTSLPENFVIDGVKAWGKAREGKQDRSSTSYTIIRAIVAIPAFVMISLFYWMSVTIVDIGRFVAAVVRGWSAKQTCTSEKPSPQRPRVKKSSSSSSESLETVYTEQEIVRPRLIKFFDTPPRPFNKYLLQRYPQAPTKQLKTLSENDNSSDTSSSDESEFYFNEDADRIYESDVQSANPADEYAGNPRLPEQDDSQGGAMRPGASGGDIAANQRGVTGSSQSPEPTQDIHHEEQRPKWQTMFKRRRKADSTV